MIEALRRNISELEEKVKDLEAENARLRAEIEHYQFLREDTERYRQFIQHEQGEFKDFLERMITFAAKVIAVIVAVGGAALAFFDIKTVNDIRRQADRSIQEQARQIKQDAKRRMQMVAKKALAGLDSRIRVLGDIVHRELMRRHARVVAAGRLEDWRSLPPTVFELLSHQGIQLDWRILPNEMEPLMQSIQNGEIDILLYYWHPEPGTEPPQDPILDQLIHTLQERSLQVPVLIYTTKPIGGPNRDHANGYGYAAFANTPMTLVTSLNALIPTFGRRSSNDTPSVP
ncbi:MAG: hypothetical protein CWE10_16520 [Symbiobacterium thermophilum]|uniref:Uncharacterized protein n=2 Tax=Symbiobacterium thermophilum TaxID=2734 RepID=A0A953LK03_SYMTR|nr:hypothetical protein [Symbiobacterium thermophilum]